MVFSPLRPTPSGTPQPSSVTVSVNSPPAHWSRTSTACAPECRAAFQQAVQAVPGPAHRVDGHLQLAQQLVEPQLGHMLLKTAASILAHDLLRPTHQTGRLEPVPLSSPYCPEASTRLSDGPGPGRHLGAGDRSLKHGAGSTAAPFHAPTARTATAVAAVPPAVTAVDAVSASFGSFATRP
ncbi:hypothetical protein GCM10023084_58600 [Streptomyces lacrimifluminis]|uniref:Uncharacterized protein n=1 Tax=Streptomyces lacrimifluminis TaxID=1500077 RepID=A0A917LBC3_9ACTN|nr:hypothetical protein GCM10012282_61000 [Streptomyces lacrimifluminis]